ncbi:relaxase domain-containing protein [Streptomyces sp. CWNU-1]|uniref:Relaxase domain-containing protein n=1 Tax=Streptomyces albipurpureus TaxID=2897419 RepID=A0ABT0UKK7_9ACTN|nr:MobF family relaxase [Streptomyces sp. CWNU-1]MCM2388802.1 relaxase domain-containing protein [Streptomyces sp. CWNU-1]
MMTIHKLSAGDGYLYYTREIATGDERRSGKRDLSDYYTAEGNPPGVWTGSGASDLGVSGPVTELQMKALFGEGIHPDADQIIEQATAQGLSAPAALRKARLGRRYYRYDRTEGPLAAKIQDAIEDFEARQGREASDPERKSLRGRVGALAFREDFGRSPKDAQELSRYISANTSCDRQAVAGYDLVFRHKYASLLWGLCDERTRREVQEAHELAIADTLAWIEQHALATRTGINGIAQEDVRGLIAARYRHYDSRCGDPLLHDHVVVANKVRGLDGKWRSIDGKLLYAMGVAASELYNQRVVEELCRRLGVQAEEREVTPGKRPVMAISGIDDDLLQAFSKRGRDIRRDLDRLLDEYRDRYKKDPDISARMALIQQAAQLSRPKKKKKARALSVLRTAWRSEAIAMFGAARIDGLLEHVRHVAQGGLASGDSVAAVDVDEAARDVLHTVSSERTVWGKRHVLAEARRQVVRLTSGRGDTRGLAERITQQVLQQGSIDITPPDLHSPFAPLLRADGTSIYRRRESQLYTSEDTLAVGSRIFEAAKRSVIPALGHDAFASVASRFVGPPLDPGQRRLAEAFACSDRLLVLGLGPAGSGKTTALQLVRDAVAASGGRLIALAPSSRAAKVMEAELGVRSHTVHRWLAQRDRLAEGRKVKDDFTLHPGDVIVVDETFMAGNRRLARITSEAETAGALIRLIGDPAQLGSVEAGGDLRRVANEVGAVGLETLHRFQTDGEAHASLTLRNADPPDAWRWYLTENRIVGGTPDAMLDAVFTAWQTDAEAGLHSLMMADDTDAVRELNVRAQAYQIASGNLDLTRSIALRDDLRAAVGDVIITRRNQPRLPVLAGHDYVKNGDQWRIERLDKSGSATVRHTGHGGRVVLPSRYLRRHGELGYASTVHRAQGLTVDTAHGLITTRTSREAAYVMATRGRRSNWLYAAAEEGQNMRDVLDTVARSNRAQLSAHETIQAEQDRAYSITQLAAEYTDVCARTVSHRLTRVARRVLGSAAEAFIESDAWSAVERSLRTAEADGWNAGALLAAAHTEHDFTDAEDPAALLSWRILARVAEGRSAAETAARRESRPGSSRPLKHLDENLLTQLLKRADSHRRDALEELHGADAAVAGQPRTVVADGLPHPAWPRRTYGYLTRADLSAAVADARRRMRQAALEGTHDAERTAAMEHTALRREQRLRKTMPPIDRMREDWQREPRKGASHTAHQPVHLTLPELTATLHRQESARNRLRRAQIIDDRIRAERRLREQLPHGPAPIADHSGPLPDWLAPSRALRDTETPEGWRQHLVERRIVLAQRLDHNGALLAAEPPAWACALGPVPRTGTNLRALWERTAALAEAWRTRHAVDDSADSIGPAPNGPDEGHAWSVLQARIAELARRARASTAARARPNTPDNGTRIAAQAAENIHLRLLDALIPDQDDHEALTRAASGFADTALHLAIEGEEPLEEWVRNIPAPDAEDDEQQAQWKRVVTALALWRMLHQTDSDEPLGESPSETGLRAQWNELEAAMTLFQRARIQQRLAEIDALRTAERSHRGLSPESPLPSTQSAQVSRRTTQVAEDEHQRQSGRPIGPRRSPGA